MPSGRMSTASLPHAEIGKIAGGTPAPRVPESFAESMDCVAPIRIGVRNKGQTCAVLEMTHAETRDRFRCDVGIGRGGRLRRVGAGRVRVAVWAGGRVRLLRVDEFARDLGARRGR